MLLLDKKLNRIFWKLLSFLLFLQIQYSFVIIFSTNISMLNKYKKFCVSISINNKEFPLKFINDYEIYSKFLFILFEKKKNYVKHIEHN